MAYFKVGRLYNLNISLFFVLIVFIPEVSQSAVADSNSVQTVSDIVSEREQDGKLSYLGKRVTVSGRANVGASVFDEDNNYLFIQDDSAGILVFFPDSLNRSVNINRGDSAVVTGRVELYYEKPEIVVEDYRVIESDSRFPSSLTLDEVYKEPEDYLGMLVEDEAVVVGKTQGKRYKKLTISPAENADRTLVVFVSGSHTQFDNFYFDKYKAGDRIAVQGIVDKYTFQNSGNTIYEILPRTTEDISYAGIPPHYVKAFLFGGGFLFLLVIGWVYTLRRQVKKQTQEIQNSLEEKEMLLREVHHRVKNSLSIVSGLIELQLDSADDPKARKLLKDSQSRIQSVGLVHDKLYQTDTFSDVKLGDYLKELVETIHETFDDHNKTVGLQFHLDAVEMDIDKMIPCGLLVNELVVNAYKHAFNQERQDTLTIELQSQNGIVELSVIDNGPGLPGDFDLSYSDSLGVMLINTFASQLEAETEIETSEEGTMFTFTFPVSD